MAIAGLAGCAVNPAPRHALPDDKGAMHDAYGAYIVAEGDSNLVVQGELIAASEDSLWVLHQDGLRAMSRVGLRRATAALYIAPLTSYTTWVTLGTIATISNGAFLLFTAPMWLIGGSVTMHVLSQQPLYKWQPRQSLAELAPYARYPAGIPQNLDRAQLTLPDRMRAVDRAH